MIPTTNYFDDFVALASVGEANCSGPHCQIGPQVAWMEVCRRWTEGSTFQHNVECAGCSVGRH